MKRKFLNLSGQRAVVDGLAPSPLEEDQSGGQRGAHERQREQEGQAVFDVGGARDDERGRKRGNEGMKGEGHDRLLCFNSFLS